VHPIGCPAGIVVAAHWGKIVIVNTISDMATRVHLKVLQGACAATGPTAHAAEEHKRFNFRLRLRF